MVKTNTQTFGSNKSAYYTQNRLKTFTVAAMLMAMNIVLSSFSIPVPGGHFYLNDCVICTAALLLDMPEAIMVAALGSFLGDAIFYPAPMFVTLITRAVQTLIIVGISHPRRGENPGLVRSIPGLLLGQAVMVLGYSIGRAFVYATPEYAVIKLPFEILQAGVGAVFGLVIVFFTPVRKVFHQLVGSGKAPKDESKTESGELNVNQ
ncbi:MAG: ECF transporter S component [Lachnospiraceae bacterium]|nr:ECF transporter S component [Lachnospiraceae bacterium]